uniref:Outer membrane receptor proteins, mostly Fe transport n=1 Tax=Candidatus Kentrum sp. FW TaxID=2126338 RepID=A0A450TWP9_9GAMM|nr:MAG: Outer membrane receptor proteins, mostly Fe transport [Candidatus Kentron sp. FW]
MKQKNTLLRNGLHLALLGPVLALGAPIIAIADNVSTDTQQDENIPAGEQGDPIELDPIVAIGRIPASTVVLGSEVDTPSNRHLKNVLKGMPNILDNSESNGVPTIRGIDGAAASGFNENAMTGNRPRVNTLVDGVARPFRGASSMSANSMSSLWDVETVEVAKGPQTTSTGRGSLTGAVNVSTRDPVHEWESALRVGYFTEHANVQGAAMVNVPLITDQVALRFTAEGSDGDKYVEFSKHPFGAEYGKKVREEEYEYYRGKLLLTPDALPDTELMFSIDETRNQGVYLPFVEDWRADDLVAFPAGVQVTEKEQWVYSAKLLQGLGEKMDLEVRVSYLDNEFKTIRSGYSPRENWLFQTETTSAEALLHFEELGLIDKGRVGVAYEHEDDESMNNSMNHNADGDDYYFRMYGDKENFAIFGEIEAGLFGGWTAIAGGRYEWDERDRTMDRVRDEPGKEWGRDQDGDEVSENVFSPKLGIRYDGADRYVAGYTYSEGWRPGGIDMWHAQDPIPVTTFDDERLKNHEIWVRANPMERLSISGSVFYYEFDDMQLRIYRRDEHGNLYPTLTGYAYQMSNIPEAKGYGMELDGQYAIDDPWRNTWTISGALGLLETEVTDAGAVPDYDDRELSQSPDVTWNLDLGWVSPRGFDAEIGVRHVGGFQQSHKPISGSGQYYDETDSYSLFDLKAGYETKFRGTELRIDAWVENLTDRRYRLPNGSPTLHQVGRPRTVGVALTAKF